MPIRNVLWLENTLGLNPQSDSTIVQNIGQSSFDTVIVAFLHPHSPYDLYINDTQLYTEQNGKLVPCDPQLIQTMAALYQQLKSGFATPKRLLISMGPFQSDFDNIAADVSTFVANFITMAQQLNLDGLDFDYEGVHDSKHMQLLVQLATTYAQQSQQANGQAPFITAAPYYDPQWWAGILAQTTTQSGNDFSWWNVQFYEGDSNPSPQSGASIFRTWYDAVSNAGANIQDVAAFITPGINADPNASPVYQPSTLTALVQNIQAQFPGEGGAFVWNYGFIQPDVQSWAEAIENAQPQAILQGAPPTKAARAQARAR